MVPVQKQIRARIRRWYVPNAIYFITAVTQGQQPLFADEVNLELLRATMRRAKEYHPFIMRAYVLLRDHFHLLIFVPETTNISRLLQFHQSRHRCQYRRSAGRDRAGMWR
jgi:REP element-mobilizing transposase RayT